MNPVFMGRFGNCVPKHRVDTGFLLSRNRDMLCDIVESEPKTSLKRAQ